MHVVLQGRQEQYELGLYIGSPYSASVHGLSLPCLIT